jgi:hypothetical protein
LTAKLEKSEHDLELTDQTRHELIYAPRPFDEYYGP